MALHGKNFSIDEDGEISVDGVAPADYVNRLRESQTFWWPESRGGGAMGNTGRSGGGSNYNA